VDLVVLVLEVDGQLAGDVNALGRDTLLNATASMMGLKKLPC
jgi:hypothetical protein